MLTALAFVCALALLIAVHEWGHYRMALACGVRVLRFSIGFGPVLLQWRGRSGTEFTLCLLPLGGYVRMLDEREAAVPEQERHLAFNTQSLRARAAIVAAGPLANLVLAVLLYATVSWVGQPQARPVLSAPAAGTLAAEAGLRSGLWVQRLALEGEEPHEIVSFDQLGWELTQAALSGQDLRLWAGSAQQSETDEYRLPLATLGPVEADARLLTRIGIVAPWSAPVIGELVAGEAGARSGLLRGDRVLSVNGQPVQDAQQLRQLIRDSLDAEGRGLAARWRLERAGQPLELMVRPEPKGEGAARVARIGAYVGAPPETVIVQEDLLGGLAQGLRRTGEVAAMTLGMIGRMVAGLASLDNLSGPISIAEYAGKSASLGPVAYLSFLALISVSLGVLNLLPIPVLDGGHLLYYLIEGVTGRSLSVLWLERLQRAGMAMLLALMSVAVFNDIARLLG
ncbi:RIP metalloprotease RseP [Malikia sp.]|uniref:RIP metalloprotease RseP n=1 Tax=Malikia sp. TaxID=2070706 RepID=UPI002638B09A|nr:RIP metalloprotease RseP [Malikia sp.]MDD2728357.1 RIP metalloprotease RseP [Malikia sp.]